MQYWHRKTNKDTQTITNLDNEANAWRCILKRSFIFIVAFPFWGWVEVMNIGVLSTGGHHISYLLVMNHNRVRLWLNNGASCRVSFVSDLQIFHARDPHILTFLCFLAFVPRRLSTSLLSRLFAPLLSVFQGFPLTCLHPHLPPATPLMYTSKCWVVEDSKMVIKSRY